MPYRALVSDILLAMRHVAGVDGDIADRLGEDITIDLAETILEQAGHFAAEVIAPLNRMGDMEGAS